MHPFAANRRILSVSDHESIRTSRELLLQSVGYSVLSLPSYSVSQEKLPNDLEIAVIGQTVDDLTASLIAASLHRTHADIRILRLTAQYSRLGAGFDNGCFVEDGPGTFLCCVAELITKAKTTTDAKTLPGVGS